VDYEEAVEWMEQRARAILDNQTPQTIWFLEHPPLYTAGTSTNIQDLINPRFPVFETGRGGQLTYHGPGQLVCYVMIDLTRYGSDLKWYVRSLESWIIQALSTIGIQGHRRDG